MHLNDHCCILNFRNGVNVEGATHKQVVDLIKSGGDSLTLTGKRTLVNLSPGINTHVPLPLFRAEIVNAVEAYYKAMVWLGSMDFTML